MKVIIFCATIIALVNSSTISKFNYFSDEFLDELEHIPKTWTSGRNFHKETSLAYITGLMGVIKNSKLFLPPVLIHEFNETLPINFDSREAWTMCPSIREIRDQGSCGSCWAFGAVEVMSDRTCIHSKGTKNFHYSAEDLTSCCSLCGYGCSGGSPGSAFSYWKNHGIVSGGSYNSNQGCQPYEIPTCEHHSSGDKPTCGDTLPTPRCVRKCESTYSVSYENDLRKAEKVYSLPEDGKQIMYEIVNNGPVEAAFDVYADFLSYKSGIYRHVSGNFLGGHAIRVIGYGEQDGIKYWLCANSWNSDWGDHGLFKILKGVNECGIECEIVAGIPE